MTSGEWKVQWRRLDQFHVSAEANRGDVSAEWFKQLQHYHVDAVERGITELIGQTKDSFLPGLGALKELIQARLDKYSRAHGQCGTCDGATWIEAWPVIFDGRLYEMLARCPDCGIPAPEMKKPHPSSRPATKLEYDEWKAGRYARDTMPEWAKAKPWKVGAQEKHKAEMREMFERLRVKLFGGAV
jgi:hypothetical protein